MHLVDTSVLTRLRHPNIRERLGALWESGTPIVSRLSALEIGFSARSGEEWAELQNALSVFEIVEVTDEDLRAALVLQRDLALRGLRGRKVPDLVIATSAVRLRAAVLHYDRDFDHIASVTGQQVEWVVPAGSVD